MLRRAYGLGVNIACKRVFLLEDAVDEVDQLLVVPCGSPSGEVRR